MKRRTMLVGAMVMSGVLVGATWGEAGPAAKGKKVEAERVGISVVKPDPKNKYGGAAVFAMSPGVKVHFRIARKDLYIISLDKDASKLTAFTDDKGTVLGTPGKSKFMDGWLGQSRVSEDGHSLGFEISSKKMPASQASRLRIKANIVISVGADEKTATSKATLKNGQTVKLGALQVKISKVGKPDWGDAKLAVEFTSTKSFDAIKELSFIGPDGKEIESTQSSSSSGGFAGRMTYTRTYNLDKKVSQVTLKTTYFGDLRKVSVPVDVNAGVGL